MELQDLYFARHDVYQVGSLSKKTMRVLPSGQNRFQKVALGDSTGALTLFDIRKGETSVSSMILELIAEIDSQVRYKSSPCEKEISALDLGGNYKSKKDKIYFAYGTTIRATSKKVIESNFVFRKNSI